jgi:purine-binding chemotaxis protein CheW
MIETTESLKILKRRAEAMAAEEGKAPVERTDFLEFGLAGESYAVELALVREVCAGKQITYIPGAPPFMAGVANIRGRILPVADLAVFFGIQAEATGRRPIIILRGRGAAGAGTAGEAQELGILADAVRGVRPIAPGEIQPPPPGFAGIHAQYLGGITSGGLIVFSADKFLAADHAAAPQAGTAQK